ncbi:hypothetical protein [Clostridium sporogenes]|uniref:hypothetical protein n=1 Tax=Clostridium sporogenes TaxID=1509 RepID=UPI00071762F1|nr:hypothetical protein [Clostridium sporogenes]KRU40061.1 hypothetical protein VT94_25380 [Clostridium sporogenes]MBY7065199.1 hypothetical protein [Clostridium sporogenes]MBY7071831.1 hypothetical protein [Clostridium sporogenes]MCW6064731.1 hypothetical protein [Clostridium sporogenes]OQP88541.1 hypothetical protein VT93_0201850 [Clostridium sporogenes]
MLDQNTDRSWWMIGAVIVGALLIGIAKKSFPEVFGLVIDFFKNMIPTQLGSIGGFFTGIF